MSISIGTITVGSLAFVLMLMLYILLRRSSLEQRLTRRLRTLEGQMAEYRDRVRVVEVHAGDYMNSLGAEGARLLNEIRDILISSEQLLQEVGSLVATRDLGALQEAELLLDGEHPEQSEPRRNFDGTLIQRYALTEGWEQRLEQMLQRLGSQVSRASTQAKEAGIPKRPKRESTIFGLFKAGIKTGRGPYDW